MELFESDLIDQNQTALAVEPEPRYQPTTAHLPVETNEHGHTWIRTIALILIGLVLVIAIVLLARWAYHRTHHVNSKTGTSKVSSNAAKLSGAADKLAAGSGSSLQNSSPSAPTNSSSAGRAATPPPASGSKIANTGPGNVVGLFVGTSLAAAGLHFVISLRRFNRASL